MNPVKNAAPTTQRKTKQQQQKLKLLSNSTATRTRNFLYLANYFLTKGGRSVLSVSEVSVKRI